MGEGSGEVLRKPKLLKNGLPSEIDNQSSEKGRCGNILLRSTHDPCLGRGGIYGKGVYTL